MSLMKMSISAGILIIAIVLIRGFSINRLPKKTFLLLWALALARLLLPFSWPSQLSVYSFVSSSTAVKQLPAAQAADFLPLSVPGDAGGAPGITPTASVSVWSIVWLAGAILFFLYFLISYLKCRSKFTGSLPVESEFAADWLESHRRIRRVGIRQSGRVNAPFTYGILRPVILLPKHMDWTDTEKLYYVLEHEMVHIRRFDAVTKILLTLALCIHWFNPLVYIMYVLSNRDLELSCDETVVRTFGMSAKSAYALTLIHMEEQKSGFMPFTNAFSKYAVEERIKAVMKMKKASVIAAAAAMALVMSVAAVFITSAVNTDAKVLTAIPDTNFTEEEYEQLLALRFDGYEKMTVVQYQEKVWTITDRADYKNLLERFSQDEQLQEMRDKNETASFLFNTLEPLTAEQWESREFGGYVQAPGGEIKGDPAMLEFQMTLKILDADALTVGEYEQTRLGIVNGIRDFLMSRSAQELQDEAAMNTAISVETERLKKKWTTEALQTDITCWFRALQYAEDENMGNNDDDSAEKRQAEPGTEADYRSLLKLKTDDYQNRSVSDFNAALLEWANEDYERNERIGVDTAMNDFHVPLTDEERAFISVTVRASGGENAELVKSEFTGQPKHDPNFGFADSTRTWEDEKRTVRANLYCQLNYHIADEDKLTVGERDHALAGVLGGMQELWDSLDIDALLSIRTEDEMLKKLNEIAENYSNELMELSFDKDNFLFESQSEPVNRE